MTWAHLVTTKMFNQNICIGKYLQFVGMDYVKMKLKVISTTNVFHKIVSWWSLLLQYPFWGKQTSTFKMIGEYNNSKFIYMFLSFKLKMLAQTEELMQLMCDRWFGSS